MAKLGKSCVFWLGLLIFAAGTFQIFILMQDVSPLLSRYIVPPTEEVVIGTAFVLAGLYMMYSGRNKLGSPAETILL